MGACTSTVCSTCWWETRSCLGTWTTCSCIKGRSTTNTNKQKLTQTHHELTSTNFELCPDPWEVALPQCAPPADEKTRSCWITLGTSSNRLKLVGTEWWKQNIFRRLQPTIFHNFPTINVQTLCVYIIICYIISIIYLHLPCLCWVPSALGPFLLGKWNEWHQIAKSISCNMYSNKMQ